ncbi:MAG: biotin carboxylase N-terminal domain-containing protein [Anaerolineae bacterium]
MITQTGMIRKLLIANRGEIACRIIRTCRAMGIATVVVYSDADARSLAVDMADEAVYIGPSPATESYLNIKAVIEAAKRTGADAIHPGFGFLAENAYFAYAVLNADLIWIGPPPSAIEAMGKKRESKLFLENVPLVPGYNGEDQANDALIKAAGDIGYPVMVKASAGGGGKGMRAVYRAEDMTEALAAARRESLQAFGDDTLIIEKLLSQPRHIEVQVFGDYHGNVIAIGERECTIQRRHQKVIEETPSTALNDVLRQKMLDTAEDIGTQLGYRSAGTVEFLVDAEKNFYFMEMNTRLQVEHPVTEEVTGVDLVRWQILIAEGNPLPEREVFSDGHAIEVRVYAEDPTNNFLPAIGEVLCWKEPHGLTGIRVDAGIRSGDAVSTYYDPMVAKVIAWGESRSDAIRRLDLALSQLQFLGLKNNIAYLRRVLLHPDHLAGNISTAFIDQHPELLGEQNELPPMAVIAAGIAQLSSEPHNAQRTTFWRNNPNRPLKQQFKYGDQSITLLLTPQSGSKYVAQIGDTVHQVQVFEMSDVEISLSVDGYRQRIAYAQGTDDTWWLHLGGVSVALKWQTPLPLPGSRADAEGALHAPMPGKVTAVLVEIGQQVRKGQTLLTLEAMKMEHRIQAPYDGKVETIRFSVGQSVPLDAVLLELASESNE